LSVVNLNKLREALSFGVRTGDNELMAAVYKTEFDQLEGQVIECDNGPKIVPRKCVRCSAEFHVTRQHADQIPAQSSFNICQSCLDELASVPELTEMAPADQKWFNDIMDEILGSESDE